MLSARSDFFTTNNTTPFEYPRLLNFDQINSFVENTVIRCLLTIRLGWPGFAQSGHSYRSLNRLRSEQTGVRVS